jgi:ABC-2 type transport system permease protein
MSTTRIWAVARNDLRILRNDPAFVIIFTAMPLLYMAFNRRVLGTALSLLGDGSYNGAEFIVPGATVLFSGFLVGNLGFGVFREHGWGTWERLRASPLSTAEIMVGKAIPALLVLAVHLTALLGGGALLMDLHLRGSLVAYVAVAVALAVCLIALGFMLLSVCRSVIQLNALTNAGAMALGGLGGAVAPVETLPGWAHAVAPATPAYWAMRGFRSVTMDGGGLPEVALPLVVLAGFSVAFALISLNRFHVEATKVSWA